MPLTEPNNPFEALWDYLPSSAQDLVELIGLDAALELIKARGGTQVRLPKTATPEHYLTGIIGYEALETLCTVYGGDTLEPPRCVNALRALRDAAILRDHREGQTIAALALKNQMTERGITKVLRRIEKKELQPWVQQASKWTQEDLFG